MSAKINGKDFQRAALKQAYLKGEKAKAEGQPASANPYATEVPQWDADKCEFIEGSEKYCPTAEQRDAWNEGYGE